MARCENPNERVSADCKDDGLEAYYLLYPVQVYRVVVIIAQIIVLIFTWTNQYLSDFYLISHPLSWVNFFMITSFAFFHITEGNKAILQFETSESVTLKDIHDENVVLEYFLMFNGVLALCLAIVNFSVMLRKEIILDPFPAFYKAEIAGKQLTRHMTLG